MFSALGIWCPDRLFRVPPGRLASPLPHHGALARRPKFATVWRKSEMNFRLCFRIAAVITTVSMFGYTAHILRVSAADQVNLEIERTHSVAVRKIVQSDWGAARDFMITASPATCVTSRSTAFLNSIRRNTACPRKECAEAITAANGVSHGQDNPWIRSFRYSQP